tara:strand:- start:232 stop:405 length:174 start_codon:yes stop_codon:yes gene_type:complete
VKREVWLILSSFGIMFAIISWMQEALIIPSASELNWRKGLYALISGLIIYLVFRKEA